MPKKLHAVCLAFLMACATAAFAQFVAEKTIASVPYYSDPAISPDGAEIAFTSGGDIWTVAAAGGEAHLLISDPAYDSRPVYSPDGNYLAFNSTRTGNGDIYIFNLKTNELKRLTFDDGNESLSAWSPDGKYVYYASTSHEISGMNDIFRVKATGGTPMPVSENRYMNEFFAMPSPDGKTLALTARGIAAQQWWRNYRRRGQRIMADVEQRRHFRLLHFRPGRHPEFMGKNSIRNAETINQLYKRPSTLANNGLQWENHCV